MEDVKPKEYSVYNKKDRKFIRWSLKNYRIVIRGKYLDICFNGEKNVVDVEFKDYMYNEIKKGKLASDIKSIINAEPLKRIYNVYLSCVIYEELDKIIEKTQKEDGLIL